MLIATLLVLAAAPEGPGRERSFGDWAVTCDNVKRCEAVAVSQAPDGRREANDARIAREPGPAGAVTIDFWPAGQSEGVITIWIDGRQMGSGFIRQEALQLTGTAAEGMARAMVTGKTLSLRAGRQVLATYSLAGSSATLRYIDAEQGRAGGVTALVAEGARAATAVPGAVALPRIVAIRPPSGKAATLDAAALAALRRQGDCDGAVPAHLKPGFHRLDAKSTLVMVPCIAGARNTSHLAFVLQGKQAVPAQFDWPATNEAGQALDLSAADTIVNYVWSNGELTTEPMPIYPGACGITQSWVWDGSRFRLALANRLGVCMRWAMWMTAYRAEVRWK